MEKTMLFEIDELMHPLMERIFGKDDPPKPKPKRKSRSKRAKVPKLRDLLG